MPPHQAQTESFWRGWKDFRSSPSQSTPTASVTTAAAADTIDHNNAEEHFTTATAPSQPDIPAPTTVEVAREAATTAFSDMKTLGSPIQSVVSAVDSTKEQVFTFLDILSKFNNIVSGFATVNVTYTIY